MTESESIYSLIPKEVAPPRKAPMHRSKYPGTIPPTGSTFGTAGTSIPGIVNMSGEIEQPPGGTHEFKRPAATFGRPRGASPVSPLRKGMGESLRAHVSPRSQPKEHVKPPVPSRDEKPIMGLKSSKNYIVSNAVENIMAVAKKPKEDPDFLHKADYGRVPDYLQKIKSDINAEYEMIRQLHEQEEEQKRANVRLLTEEEREVLVNGLKAKWETVNREYQNMTHLVKLDTVGKIRRKEQYESELAQIEKDIERINKRYIFVDNTQ